jgi:nucleoside-diphosphate-sugar epimerase
MSNYIVFGGSGGLGRKIVSDLLARRHTVISVSRGRDKAENSTRCRHFSLDLSDLKENDLCDLFSMSGTVDGVCFAHRYRPEGQICPSGEYISSVHSVARIIDYIQSKRGMLEDRCCRVLIIGSSYTYSAGRDQGWSYHACKHAQQGLVRYFSANSSDGLLIFMVSPPTFIKEGAEVYWSSNRKSELWKKFPSKGLVSVCAVSELCCQMLTEGSPLLNGCNIPADSGLSNIYQDQIVE